MSNADEATAISEPVEPVATTAKKTKKRNRGKPKSLVAGPGVCILGDRFVCSYSAQIRTHAIFVPGVDTVCFANVPCAFAWLEENVKNSPELLLKLKQATADEYQQPLESIERAPPRETLADFGGKLYYSDWFSHLLFWDQLTEANGGMTVSEYKNRNNNTAVKRGKGAQSRVAFEAAMYVIGHGGGAGKCKKINGVDGAVDEAASKALLTPVRAQRKLTNFINTHAEGENIVFKREYVEGDNYTGTVLVAIAPHSPDAKFHNHIATQVVGVDVYGPAVITFTRKHSQKI